MVPGTTSVLIPSDPALALGFQMFSELLDPLPVPGSELATSLRSRKGVGVPDTMPWAWAQPTAAELARAQGWKVGE